jgi:hypothetical protein
MKTDPANLIRFQIAPSVFGTEELGLKLRPYQERFINCPSNTVAALWSRQTGKTFSTSVRVASFMATRPNQTALVVSPAQRQSQLMGATVRKMLLKARLRLEIDSQQVLSLAPKQIGENSVVMLSPSGNDGASIRGPSVGLLVIEEAAFVAEAVLQAALPMVAANPNAQIVYISSAGIMGSWFERLWNDPKVTMERQLITAEQSGAFSPEMLDRLRATLGPKRYAQEMECVFGSESGTSVFSQEVLNSLFSPRSMGEETSADAGSYPVGNIRKPDFGGMFAPKSAFAGR